MTPPRPLTPKGAVDAIVRDLSERRGLRQEWDQIDDDVRREIRAVWVSIIKRVKP